MAEGPAGAGAKYLAKRKQSGKIEVHCVEVERPRQVRFFNGGPIEVDLAVSLEATPLGTRIDARPRGLFAPARVARRSRRSSRPRWGRGRAPRPWP